MFVKVEEVEVDESSECAQTSAFAHTRYVQPEAPEEELPWRSVRDVGSQLRHWQSFSSDEIAEEIAYRLSTHRFAFTSNEPVPLHRDYHRREAYKKGGEPPTMESNKTMVISSWQ